jgi:hypothetical protein
LRRAAPGLRLGHAFYVIELKKVLSRYSARPHFPRGGFGR